MDSDSSMSSVDPSKGDPMVGESKIVLLECEQGVSSEVTSSDSNTTELNNTLTSLTPDPDLSNTDVSYSSGTKDCKDPSFSLSLSSSCVTDESLDEASPQKRSKKLAGCSSPKWHMNKCFDRYWKHYQQSMAWSQRHFYMMKYMSSCMSYTPPYHQVNTNSSRYVTPNVGRGQQFKMGRGYGRGRGRSRGGLGRGAGQQNHAVKRQGDHEKTIRPPETESDVGLESDDSEVYEMELTEEMVQFFAHSEEHRKQRDASKEIIGEDGNVQKRIQIEEVKANKKAPTVEAPSERPGVRRTAEMMKLYGKGAAMIHGMETAVQMSYDRTIDIQQPKFWPNMPLKIVFS